MEGWEGGKEEKITSSLQTYGSRSSIDPRSTITHGVLHLNVRTRYIYEENISKSLVNINRR